MKQLFLLVLKYIRRQRFRTVLTFLCILLSVFVFNLLCDAFVVVRGVGIGEILEWNGAWEVDLDPLIKKMDDPASALDIIRNHPAVEKYSRKGSASLYNFNGRDENGYMDYLEYSVDGKEFHRITSFTQMTMEGDTDLNGRVEIGEVPFEQVKEGGITLPNEYSKLGFKVGDTVTLRLRGVRAKFSDDQPLLAEDVNASIANRKRRAEDFGEVFLPEQVYRDSPGGKKYGESYIGSTLFDLARSKKVLDQLTAEDETFGETLTYTGKILSFTSYSNTPQIYAELDQFNLFSAVDSSRIMYSMNSNDEMEYALQLRETEEWDGFEGERYDGISIITKQDMDFDEAVAAIYADLGLPKDDMDEILHPSELSKMSRLYNVSLLRLRFRGQDSIAAWLTDTESLCIVAMFLFVAFLVWALMRFVIDNCFEISVQERSAQFATLRIMGASRRQIGIVVGFEALFYCIAAVPLGVFLSYLCRTAVFHALDRLGQPVSDTSFPLLTVLGVVLALTAILVSSYTSSMWAARAYNPLEASRKTHLKGNSKQSIWTKNLFGGDTVKPTKQEKKAESLAKPTGDLKKVKYSRLNRGQKSFLRNYTMRNMRRTRSRFVISIISLSLGTMLFAFGMALAAPLVVDQQEKNLYREKDDFRVQIPIMPENGETLEKTRAIEDYIRSSTKISLCSQDIDFGDSIVDLQLQNAELMKKLKYDLEYGQEIMGTSFEVLMIGELGYTQEYEKITGISYSDLLTSGGCLVEDNVCGPMNKWKQDDRYDRLPEFTGREPEFVALTDKTADLRVVDYTMNDLVESENSFRATPVVGIVKLESLSSLPRLLIPVETVLKEFADVFEQFGGLKKMQVEYRMQLLNSADYKETAEKIRGIADQIQAESGSLENQVQFYDIYFLRTGTESLIWTIITIGGIALAAVWLTGIFTMLNTVNTSVLNRAEELAMLRMIGMSRKMMRKTVMLESTIYCIFSTVIGGILGISGSFYMMTGMYFFQGREELVFVILGVVLTSIILANYVISRLAARPSLHTLNRYLASGRMMQ